MSAARALDGPGWASGRCGPIRTLVRTVASRCSLRRERHRARSSRLFVGDPKGRDICHFLAGLLLLLIINLTPSSALGKVVRFTDSQGVIHINSADHEPAEKSGEAGVKQAPASRGNLAQGAVSEPAGTMGPPPPVEPPAEPVPGSEHHGPPPDLGAIGQPGVPPPVAQSRPVGKTALLQETNPDSVPYTPEGDPFLNPSFPPAAARQSQAPGGGMASFQDHRGVRQITNLAATPEPEAKRQAAPSPGQGLPGTSGLLPAIQPTSWQPATLRRPATIEATRGSRPVISGEAVVYRFQDRRGVCHITNVLPSGEASPAPYPATRIAEAAPAPEVVKRLSFQASPACALAPATMKSGAGLAAGRSSVRSYLDRRGVLHICNAPAQEGPQGETLAFLARLKENYGPFITEASHTYRLPPALVMAIIQMESQFVPGAVSPKGAQGLMQLMPATASCLGVQDPFNPRENILAGCRYLRDLLDQFQGSLPLAVAAYNAGDRRVVAAGNTIPAIKETQVFVRGVLNLYYLIEQNRQRIFAF